MPFSDLVVSPSQAPGRWVLEKPMCYTTPDSAQRIHIPAGFETDLASIPRMLRPLIAVNGNHRKAAVLHDFLYHTGYVTRAFADKAFRIAMGELGVPRWKRALMYFGVRGFGWLFFRKREKLAKKEQKRMRLAERDR